MVGKNLPRGIRNNNPFNIRKSESNWLGKIKSSDNDFEQFDNMVHGLRAGLKLLCNYVHDGFDTPFKIINRFAPINENATRNYISFVRSDSLSRLPWISSNTKIDTPEKLCRLASRMVAYENGLNYAQIVNFGANPKCLFKIFQEFNLSL